MKLKHYLLFGLVTVFMSRSVEVWAQELKPRVIAMTDGEIDDRSSMVRFYFIQTIISVWLMTLISF